MMFDSSDKQIALHNSSSYNRARVDQEISERGINYDSGSLRQELGAQPPEAVHIGWLIL